jgi:DNA-binding CsgD family transcriptional regulator
MDSLERGRRAFERGDWPDAYQYLSEADREGRLDANDLWRMGRAALLVGRDEAYLDALERACATHRVDGDTEAAARCAFWIGFRLADRGEVARASGWFARARRLVEAIDGVRGVHGWLVIPSARAHLASGDAGAAYAEAARAAGIAEAVGDRDLAAIAVHLQGLARLHDGRLREGLMLLDEAMLDVTGGALSPIVTGIVYCSAIAACRDVYALRRSQEWTEALTDWCDHQPGLVPFAGTCLVHRAEILQLHGAWDQALEEARRAEARCRKADDPPDVAAAVYAQAEVLRLQGDVSGAAEAYDAVARLGRDPQPGLALLRSQQGWHGIATAALRRALEESSGPTPRARLLPAAVEVRLAADDLPGATAALDELEAIAADRPGGALGAAAQEARGAVALARNDAAAALVALRDAWRGWQALEAPYRAARVRESVGRACEALGDAEAAEVELDAAREVYRELGADADLRRLSRSSDRRHGLTARELEVVRLVAAGASNKEVAARLGLSVRTVERHLSNIYAKLEVGSRSAATAYAHRHALV